MEFRKMRRSAQQIPDEEALQIIEESRYGTLAVLGDGGYPYAVPLNYVLLDGKLYFHCAKTGHKVDAIRACDKVSFSIVARSDVDAASYTSIFRSVTVFGRARIVTDGSEALRALCALGNKFNPNQSAALEAEIEKGLAHLLMVAIEPEHITGKEAVELTQARRRPQGGE